MRILIFRFKSGIILFYGNIKNLKRVKYQSIITISDGYREETIIFNVSFLCLISSNKEYDKSIIH